MKRIIRSEKAPRPIGPYSQAVEAGGFLFGSGQIPVDPATGEIVKGDIRIQTRRVLENIKAVLDAASYRMEDIVKTTVFLSNLEDFPAFNEEYSKFFLGDPPARTTVQVAKLPKGVLLEIDFIAYRVKEENRSARP